MSKQLDELLFSIRQHPAFRELLAAVDPPEPRLYKPAEHVDTQWADYIFRSGRRLQDECWRQFLIGEQQERT